MKFMMLDRLKKRSRKKPTAAVNVINDKMRAGSKNGTLSMETSAKSAKNKYKTVQQPMIIKIIK